MNLAGTRGTPQGVDSLATSSLSTGQLQAELSGLFSLELGWAA